MGFCKPKPKKLADPLASIGGDSEISGFEFHVLSFGFPVLSFEFSVQQYYSLPSSIEALEKVEHFQELKTEN